MIKMSLTKKRIIALISAFILLITAAILPIGQNLNPFGTIKASAANLTQTQAEQLTAFEAVGNIEVILNIDELRDNMATGISSMAIRDHNTNSITDGIAYSSSSLNNRTGTAAEGGVGSFERTGSVTFTVLGEDFTGNFTFNGVANSDKTVTGIENNSGTFTVYGTTYRFGAFDCPDNTYPYLYTLAGITITTYPNVDIVLHNGEDETHIGHTSSSTGRIDYFPTPSKEGYTFDGWYSDEALTIPLEVPGDEDYRDKFKYTGGEFWAKFTEIPPVDNDRPKRRRPSNSSTSTSETDPAAEAPAAEPTTPVVPPALENTTPAADVKIEETPTEDGKIALTVGGEKVETTSTSAAQAIASGEAKAVVTSGSAVAVVKEDNTVVAGANATGSLNSATTVDAVKAAAALLTEGVKEVKVEVGTDVNAISKSTLEKIAAAAAESGVDVTISTEATDETGNVVASIDIHVFEEIGDVKTGIVLKDTLIDEEATKLAEKTGNTILASFRTEQKSSFGAKLDFAVDTAAIGLKNAVEGDTLYIAIKRGDGVTVQVIGKIVEGKLTFSAKSAGVMMISNTSFAKKYN
jgi:uncharacterized repeat protein (TIGR02543 family)